MAIDLSSLSAREAITAIYIGYYDRAPDPVGIAFWEDVIDMTSLDLVAITSDFAGQDETLALFPFFADPSSTSASAFITQVYLNLFNREPDADGLAFWTAALEAAVAGEDGALSVGQIITSIIEGAQSEADGGFPDEEIVLNKIEAALDWTSSIEAAGISFDLAGATGANARAVIDGIDESEASVVTARSETDAFVAANTPGVPGETIILSAEAQRDNLTGTEGNDIFEAFNAELQDGDRMDGGSGTDVFTYFSSDGGFFDGFGTAVSPITNSVEQVVITNQVNDENSNADNNVGGYGDFDGTVEVDVEIDAGMMSGVTRWEDYDSRADLVIEDARDQDDTDGTFTGDITVAMVSTDPGNVDYAVYFDQPVNVSQNFGTLELRVLDQEAAFNRPPPSASSTGYLTESSLIEFTFAFNGQEITVELADEEGVTYGANVSFQDLLDEVEAATQQALVDAGVTESLGFSATLGAPVSVGVGNQFTLPLVLTFDVPADTITASSDDIIVTGRDSGNNGATPATDTFGSLTTARQTQEELIRLNVELDDVGKGSMGGDALFGAMSTGRQTGDDGTSDSIGIQQFDIEVDRSSQLQTINSTNNSLEVVNITNGENDGPNNTTTAADEQVGSLTVRGQANPDVIDVLTGSLPSIFTDVATDSPMPGAVPQHNSYGFSDVRVINAASMVGAVDLTAELTEEVVEKYLDIQDSAPNGEVDDVDFLYDLGANSDEFFLNMSNAALDAAGTASREDFDLSITGGAGADVITTNIGDTVYTANMTMGGGTFTADFDKRIDEQGQDHYTMNSVGGTWYRNTVSNIAAELRVDGGTGNDIIWTHGWGDFEINDGAGSDVVYTDNSGATEIFQTMASAFGTPGNNIDRFSLEEHEQIDYVMGDGWTFNAEFGGPGGTQGATNEDILLATLPVGSALRSATSGVFNIVLSFEGAGGTATNDYTVTAEIPFSQISVNATTGAVTITEQAMNQAIKAGVNGNFILSNLLEATDGPGNSLNVVTKTDGDYDADDFSVSLGSLTLNGTSVAVTATTVPGYTNPLFTDIGVDSTAESDNTIIVAGDNVGDLYVLSTSDAAAPQPFANTALDAATDLNSASNEKLVFNAGFGRDTVLNFDAGAGDGVNAADDVFDFTPITGVAVNTYFGAGSAALETAGLATNGSVDWIDLATVTVDGADAGTDLSALEVAALFTDKGAASAAQTDHILIITDATNLSTSVPSTQNAGQVWHIVDGAGTAGVTATQVGTINLIGTDWSALNTDNFA